MKEERRGNSTFFVRTGLHVDQVSKVLPHGAKGKISGKTCCLPPKKETVDRITDYAKEADKK